MNKQEWREWRDYHQDGLAITVIIASILLFLVAVVVVALVMSNHSGHVSCLRLWETTGMETRYVRSGAEGECYIHINGQWVPESRWRPIS